MNGICRHHRLSLLMWVLSAIFTFQLIGPQVGAAAEGQPSDNQRLAQQLRQRRLFALAEKHCRQQLQRQDLSPREQAVLTIELIRTYIDQAYQAKAEDRAAFWKSAHQTARAFIDTKPQHAFLRLVEVQDALTELAAGILLRQEIESSGEDALSRELALNNFRSSSRALEKLDQQLADDIVQAKTDTPFSQGMTNQQLVALQNHVRFHAAQAYMNRAMLHGEDDQLNRIDALQRVKETHQRLMRSITPEDPLWWDLQIDRLICFRLLADYEQVDSILVELSSDQNRSAELSARILAEYLRVALARQDLKTAQEIVGQQKDQVHVSAEFNLACVEALLAFAAAANSQEEASQRQGAAVELTKKMEQSHGRYWSRRANMLLVKSAGKNPAFADLQVLTRVADATYLKGEFDNAIKAYETAAAKAAQLQDGQQQFELLYKAALVQHKRQNYGDASRRLRELSNQLKAHPQAPQAHLLAVVDAAELVKQDANAIKQYEELLSEQIRNWPTVESSDQARIWYSSILVHQQKPLAAVDLLTSVDVRSSLFIPAIRQAGELASAILSRATEKSETQRLLQAFAPIYERAFTKAELEFPLHQYWAMAVSANVISQAGTAIERADLEKLNSALHEQETLPPELAVQLASLLAFEYGARQGDAEQFQRAVMRLTETDPQRSLLTIKRILEAGKLDANIAARLPAVVATLTSKQNSLNEPSRSLLLTLTAKTAAASGDDAQAIDLFQKLVAERPRELAIRIEYAQLLNRSTKQSDLQLALDQWRIVASLTRPQSQDWFLAKYKVALTLHLLGQDDKANDLLVYLKEIPPGWEQSELKRDFEKLLQETK